MSKKQQLLEYYTKVLNALDCVVEENGYISYAPSPHVPPEPVTIMKGKRLAVPTDFVLANLYQDTIVGFHPLSEVIVLGQSAVIQTTRQIVNASLTHKILSTMLGICTGISKQVTMTAKQTEFVNSLDKVDEKTVKSLSRLMQVIDPESQFRVVNVFLKHGGILHDKQYKRVCTVNFPLYHALLEADDTVYGVKMRKQDIKLLIKMLEVLFPQIDEPNAYSFGTDTLVCPYFIALLGGFKNVVVELNRATFKFKKIIEEYTGMLPHTNVDFIDDIGDGTIFKDIIPPLEHNRGVEQGKKTEEPEQMHQVPVQQAQALVPIQQPMPVQQRVQPIAYQQPVQPIMQPASKPNPYAGLVKTKLGSDVDLSNAKVKESRNDGYNTQTNDFLQAAYPAAVYGQPVMQPMAYPQAQMPQPMYPQAQMPQPMYPQAQMPQPMYQQPPMQPMAMQQMPMQPVMAGYPMGQQQMGYGYPQQQMGMPPVAPSYPKFR